MNTRKHTSTPCTSFKSAGPLEGSTAWRRQVMTLQHLTTLIVTAMVGEGDEDLVI